MAVEHVFKRVRVAVEAATGGAQTPWEESSLRGDFYFVPGAPGGQGPAPSASGVVNDAALELAFWNSVRDSANVAAFEEFLKQFPTGKFAGLAQIRVEELKQKVAVGVLPEQPAAPPTRRYKPGDRFRDCDGCPEMVVVPAGAVHHGLSPGRGGAIRRRGPAARSSNCE